MPLSMRADSTEYVTATITADHDITESPIDVSLPSAGVAPSTWYPAEVLTVTQAAGGVRWVATYRVLVGPVGGALSLTPGSYDWTVKVSDTPETPVRKSGSLIVTAN